MGLAGAPDLKLDWVVVAGVEAAVLVSLDALAAPPPLDREAPPFFLEPWADAAGDDEAVLFPRPQLLLPLPLPLPPVPAFVLAEEEAPPRHVEEASAIFVPCLGVSVESE